MPNTSHLPCPKLTLPHSSQTYSSYRFFHLRKQQFHTPHPIPQQILVTPPSKYSQFLRFLPPPWSETLSGPRVSLTVRSPSFSSSLPWSILNTATLVILLKSKPTQNSPRLTVSSLRWIG